MRTDMRPVEGHERSVRIPAGDVVLDADLSVPRDAAGIVLFAHGSGSGRLSPRNRFVAARLQEDWRLATLLLDLLTREEEAIDARTTRLRFDLPMLARRLVAATDWVGLQPEPLDLPLGYFGASTGAGAALLAAVERPDMVTAIVSRGGRPDLAGPMLTQVRAPTLLIVGGEDHVVLRLNRQALTTLTCPRRLAVVPGATHLFEEPGALEVVADLAGAWLHEHFMGCESAE